ncbi:hypothetical protein IWZ00DRAFT_489958 [Phyllosticta capitalensis]
MPYSAQALPVLERFVDSGITKQHLEEASQLFSTHNATWGPLAATQLGPWAEARKRVKMSPQRLKRECLAAAEEEGRLAGDGAAGAARTEGVVDVHNEYVRAFVICNGDGKSAPKVVDTESATGESTRLASSSQPERQIVGHVFATRWRDGQGRRVCWITQVVVHREWRRRGIATAMLRHIATASLTPASTAPTLFGVLSSHTATLRACVRAVTGLALPEGVDKSLIRALARPVMATAPVKYVREAELRTSLPVQADATTKESDDGAGAVLSAFTNFFVDHAEPNMARAIAMSEFGGVWPLGELDEGCEFLVLCCGSG